MASVRTVGSQADNNIARSQDNRLFGDRINSTLSLLGWTISCDA